MSAESSTSIHTKIGKNQAQTCSAVAMSRRCAELKPGNRGFSPKSPKSSSKSPLTGRRMGPALTDRTGIRKNLSHTCIGKQHRDVCAWRRESGRNWAQKQPKCTIREQLNLHIHTFWKWVFDYKRQDAHKGIDFRHQGGATCKFSGQFTVELVRTKNRTFHHRNLTKSIVLTQVTW